MEKILNVGIFLFDEMEVLDFAGPFEVFSVTAELHNYSLFKVFTISEDGAAVRAVNGLRVLPDASFKNHLPIDILIIPGGAGTKVEMKKPSVLTWLKEQYDHSQLTMSVCSGTRLLGTLGLLDNIAMTTHHEVIPDMRQIAPNAIIKEDVRFTDNGKILTSAGISAGIDLSLYIVTKLFGTVVADKTIAYMEYGDWKKSK